MTSQPLLVLQLSGALRSHNLEPAVLAILPPANYLATVPGMEDELHLDAL